MVDTDVARWEQDFVAEPVHVAEARRAVSAYAASIGVPDEIVRDIALAVSEAATNAVIHAFVGREPGLLRIVAVPGDDELRISVVDDGSGLVPRSDSPGLGLGLPTIGQLTESFDIRDGHDGRGTEVRMVFGVPGMRAPAPPVTAEDWRFELLAEVARLAGTGWPGPGVERLVELLVPRIADACAVDLVEQGVPHRVAARVDDDPELSAWLAARRPPAAIMSDILDVLRRGDLHITSVDATSNAALAQDDADIERMEAARLAWWVNVPLMDGDVLLGSLGIGLRAERPAPGDQLSFLAALGERAARGLANRQVLDELRRTRERLEGVLGALSEAVTVHDREGRFVYVNTAAVHLLGAGSAEEILRAEPGDLAGRFEILDADGNRIGLDDLPGQQLARGERARPLLSRSTNLITGRTWWLYTRSQFLEGDDSLIVNVIEDVTRREEAERRLRALGEEP